MTTLGHPFWVVGQGWRMAKELNVGDQLHAIKGGVVIDAIDEGPIAQAHNLVVAESSNYFVGTQRLLVHDNTVREAIEMPLPGWLALND